MPPTCSSGPSPCQIMKRILIRASHQCLFVVTCTLIVLMMSLAIASAAKAPPDGKTKISVGCEIDYPPYSFLGKNGEPTGFQIELTRAIAKTMGMDIEFRLRPWPESRKALEDGSIDIIPGMFYSDERARTFDFSPPFSFVSSAIFARKGSPSVKSIEDLRNKEIVVMRGEAMHDYIIRHHLTERLIITETPTDAVRMLASGKGDYALVAQMPGLYWIRELNLSNIETVGPALEPFKNCFAVRKGNAPLLSRFTEGINILNQTGEVQRIYEKWLGVLEPTRITLWMALKYVAIVIVPLILLLAVSLLWSWMLRSKVNQKTKELKESESMLRQILDTVPQSIFWKDKNSVYLGCNTVFARAVGLNSAEKIIGKTDFELPWPQAEAEAYRADDREVIASGKPKIHIHEPLQQADGKRLWIDTSKMALLDDRQKTKGVLGIYDDITERKHAEDMLSESEERYRTLFERNSNPIAILNNQGKFLEANSACVEFMECPREELLAKVIFDFFPREKRESMGNEHALLWETGGQVEAEHDIHGQIKTLDLTITPIVWKGEPAAIGVGNDITKRKQAEDELRDRENRYRALYEGALNPIMIVDENGKYIDANEAALHFLETDKDDLLKKNVWDYSPPKLIEEQMREHRPFLEPRTVETVYLVNGKEKTLLLNVVPIKYEGRSVLIGIGQDISERKKAEKEIKNKNEEINAAYQQLAASGKELEEKYRELAESRTALMKSEERYRLIFNQSPLGIMHFDANGKILDLNDNFSRIMGAAREVILGFNMLERLRDQKMLQAVKNALGGRLGHYEGEYLSVTGGKTTPIRAIYQTIVGVNNEFIGAVGLFEDISAQKQAEKERRELEERLQRAEKMEALGLLAGGVAHDLNNALGILVGYSELLYDGLKEGDPLREDARNIIVGGEQAAAIVEDLLTLARRGVQTKKAVNLSKTVEEYLKSPEHFKLMSYHSGIRIKTDLEEKLLMIRGSGVHISKTLMNLVANAVEAMSSGGEVTIRTENRYLDTPISGYDQLQEGDYVVLTVSDEGEGISEDDMKRIFEPFYTKKVMGRSGTGLGLAVVWGTVKDHNGCIDVHSIRGRGTTFTLYFPVTYDELKEASLASQEDYLGHGEKILVVDDIQNQRELANRILTKLNYRVDTASGGEEAIAYLKVNDVDLIVLGMIMDPGIDGFETYRRITEFKPGQRAIIVSGFAETERVKMTQSLGAGDFVRKPYIKERVGLAVRRELDRK